MSTADYDLAIIGAGAAGLTGADFALELGARVALIEQDRIGGDCTWSGCVPSKSLIKVASVAAQARRAALFGLEVAEPAADLARVREYLRSTCNGRLLGATVMAERAGEMLAGLALAVASHLTLGQVASAIHPYPSYNAAIQLLASRMAVRQSLSGRKGKLVRALIRD